MGATAFILLIAAEFCLSVLAFGRSVPDLATYHSWPALLGLTAQVGFAAFPLLREPSRP
jgi:hypothetical protein